VKKFTVKTTHSIEGCERTDSENITQLCGINKLLKGHEVRKIESPDSEDETELVAGNCNSNVTLRGTKGFLMDCLEQHNGTSLISCYYLG
jgi:hypothetical protein